MPINLNDLPLDSFKEFTNYSLDIMTGYVPKKWPTSTDTKIKDDDIEKMKKKMHSIFVHLTYSSNHESDDLSAILDDDKSSYVFELFTQRKLDIALALLKDHNASVKPILDNFDWKLNWVVGSSASTSLKYPLIHLDLVTLQRNNNLTNVDNIYLELTKDELDVLIHNLETAK